VRRLAIGCVLLTSACLGDIVGNPKDPVDDDGPRNICEDGAADVAGPRLLRRLTSNELTASIRGGFGLSETEWAGAAVPADPASADGFTNNVDRLIVDDGYARGLLATAEGVAVAVTEPTVLARVLPCASGGGEACARTYLDTVGRRLFRRPLTDTERQRYLDLHAQIAGSEGFTTWVQWATSALVQSPNFLYRSELGEPDGEGYQLTGYEIATALAYGLTGGPPDDALLDRAGAGELDSAEGIAAAARELAARPELHVVFRAFVDHWLGLSSLPNLVKIDAAFTPEIRDAMRRETDAFIEQVVFTDRGGIAELLTSPISVVDATLAAWYGWGGGGTPTERPAGWGVGLLAQGSVMAVNAGNEHTSPTQRGVLVRERLLCQDMPPPPPVVGEIPTPTGTETTRQRYEVHTSNDACSGCHELMDPIGFAFEHLDAMGRYRETEGTLPIDATGAINGFDTPITVDGPTELAAALASRPEPAACLAAFMASDLYGLDHHDTSCLVTSLADQLASGEISIADFYVGLTTTVHFTRRTD